MCTKFNRMDVRNLCARIYSDVHTCKHLCVCTHSDVHTCIGQISTFGILFLNCGLSHLSFSHLLLESESLILHPLTSNPQGQVRSGSRQSRSQTIVCIYVHMCMCVHACTYKACVPWNADGGQSQRWGWFSPSFLFSVDSRDWPQAPRLVPSPAEILLAPTLLPLRQPPTELKTPCFSQRAGQ